jgi:hypothetical protein
LEINEGIRKKVQRDEWEGTSSTMMMDLWSIFLYVLPLNKRSWIENEP